MKTIDMLAKYEPTQYNWGGTSPDKVSLRFAHRLLNQEAKCLYRTGPITVKEVGMHAFVMFHAESLHPMMPLSFMIAIHLLGLAKNGLFVGELEESLLKLPDTFRLFGALGVTASLECFFTPSELEFAFDFVGTPPWVICDERAFIQVGGTLTRYSRKDRERTGAKSLVIIYNHAQCHGYEGEVTRFELRLTEDFLGRWSISKLDAPFDAVLATNCNQIAGSLHTALPPASMDWDLKTVESSHPLLAPILKRWIAWGKPRST